MRKTFWWVGLSLLGLSLVSWTGACSDSGSSGGGNGETTAASCQDGQDNDGDGQTDCDDTDCQGFVFCQEAGENTSTACQDGQDNDGDGQTDCDDEGCQGFVFCQGGGENTSTACQDGQDNDGDGQTDCDDTDCQGFVFCQEAGENTSTACQDGQDNDGDGQTDCDDEDCQGFVFCAPDTEDTATACQDHMDNDDDGFVDCADTDCQGFVFCFSLEETTSFTCQDGQDNDDDGMTDCDDPDCQGFVFCQSEETTATACQDGVDNDNDGQTDCADSDCEGFVFCQSEETTSAACQDGIDNDNDGMTDCADSDCQGFVFCQSEETTATACQDGVDNDSDGQTDCDDTDCQGFVFCLASEDSYSLCQDGLDNDNDGQTDCDDTDCWHWSYCQHYNGYPVVDAWGETWDGIERGAATWAEAKAICESLGGRLPTITELYRNNTSTGTGNLSNSSATNYLWTLIASHTAGNRVTVRLSDGAVGYTPETSTYHYRCVWPDNEGTGFDQYRCYGNPDEPCWSFQHVWNMDQWDRPAVSYAAAVNECAFYGASIPVVAEWGQAIHRGLANGSNQWAWAGNVMYWYNGGYGRAIIRWTDDAASHWTYRYNTYGAVSGSTSNRRFRCVGLEQPTSFQPPSTSCQGGCFDVTQRRSHVLADSQDRVATRMAVAVEDCRDEGADLLNAADFTELVHAGWPDGTNGWNWLSDTLYWYSGGYGNALARWSGTGSEDWYWNSSTGARSAASSNRAYRCFWRPMGPALPTCNATDIVVWDGDGYACHAGADGTSNGQANVVEILDDWGNAWDGIQRDVALTYDEAAAQCESLGARLPTATEIWAVRATGNPNNSIGDINSTSYLWTKTPTGDAGRRVRVRISDGGAQAGQETSTAYYRCIWPSRRGDVLATNNCYGPPGDECFTTTDGLVADKYDRVAVDAASAIEECLASGGHLPDHREAIRLLHSGWPNGTNQWLWMNESMYWYSGHYGYPLIRWTGDGPADWEYTTGLSDPTQLRRFRCVYDQRLR